MNRFKLGRPSPALVIACIALFVALGGVGYAAATGSIDSRELKNNSVAGKDVKNSSLTGTDVKNSGLTGSDVNADSLTGSDIAESGLGKVPSAGTADSASTASTATNATNATNAGNANTVGGVRMIPFSYRNDTGLAPKTVTTVNGVEIIVGCSVFDPDLTLKNVSGGTAEVNFANVWQADNITRSSLNKALPNTSAIDLSPGGDGEDGASGQAGFVGPSGRPVRMQYTLNRHVNGFDCSINGVITG